MKTATLLLTLFFVQDTLAQTKPPTCPLPPGTTAQSASPTPPTFEALQAVASAASADPSFLVSAEPIQNFDIDRYRLIDYTECTGSNGCYWTDLDAQARRAEDQLTRLVAAHKGEAKLALVLDIDETSLSSYCEEKREDYGFIASMNTAWVISPQASIPIPGTLRLFNHARSLGVDVFFITGRPQNQAEATTKNLNIAGYQGWKELVTRQNSEQSISTTEYKANARAKIAAQGYRILLNMGDQWSDLNGTPKAEISVKLPNAYYYLP